MRFFLAAALVALLVPLAARAQAPKPVEVINDPLAVEIVNPAPQVSRVRASRQNRNGLRTKAGYLATGHICCWRRVSGMRSRSRR